MLPALRLGYIVAPEWAMRTLIVAKNCMDWHCSMPVQVGVSRFISDGHLSRHVHKMRQIYGKRRQMLLDSLEEGFKKWLRPIPSFYGMHVTAISTASLDLDLIAEELLQRNLKIHTLSRYYCGPKRSAGLVFGFGTTDLSEMQQGLSLLRQALLRRGR
jgi:GntR family transcriptional regulator/MocR family aminotransferase